MSDSNETQSFEEKGERKTEARDGNATLEKMIGPKLQFAASGPNARQSPTEQQVPLNSKLGAATYITCAVAFLC